MGKYLRIAILIWVFTTQVGCTLVEVHVSQRAILDVGDQTKDGYREEGDSDAEETDINVKPY